MVVEGQDAKSEETQQTERAADTVSPDQFNQLMEQVQQLKSSNERLLGESKNWKSKYQEVKGEVEKVEQHKLEEKKDWQGLLDLQKRKTEEIENKYGSLKKETMRRSLQLEVAKYAKDAHDVMDIYSNLPEDQVAYNEQTMSFEGVKDAVDSLREKKNYLFTRPDLPTMASSRPETQKTKSVDDQIKENPKAVLDELLRQKFST